jgi:hypothetical protein
MEVGSKSNGFRAPVATSTLDFFDFLMEVAKRIETQGCIETENDAKTGFVVSFAVERTGRLLTWGL